MSESKVSGGDFPALGAMGSALNGSSDGDRKTAPYTFKQILLFVGMVVLLSVGIVVADALGMDPDALPLVFMVLGMGLSVGFSLFVVSKKDYSENPSSDQ